MQTFSDKVVVVTGATSGIGLAAAGLFARAGARVSAFARHDADVARRAIAPLGALMLGDVARSADVERLFATTAATMGRIDVLFVNAALAKLAPIGDTDDALLDQIVQINLAGSFRTLRAALPHLVDGASVIVTTSFLDRIGFPGSSALSMTKAALRALVRVAAAELAPRRIRVNALCPGAIETPLWGKLGVPSEALEAAGAAITARIPLGRWGSADEVARAALFLASPESSYINGIELGVDGGLYQT